MIETKVSTLWSLHSTWCPQEQVCAPVEEMSRIPYFLRSISGKPEPPSASLLLLFSCEVVSHSWWPHELQHTRLPYPSLSPGVCSNSCPLSRWCHTTISSSVTPIFSCLQFFPALASFPMSWPHIRWPNYWSFSFSISPSNIQGWFPFRLTGLMSLLSLGLSRVFSNTTVQKHQF